MNKKGFRFLFVLLAVILFAQVYTASYAETVRNPLAIDLMVVIENSTQMNKDRNNERTLDRKGLRFDAAAALISMCDTKFSRAGFILFNKDIYRYSKTQTGNVQKVTPEEIALTDIYWPEHKTKREDLMEILNSDKIRNGYGNKEGVDIGKALSTAVTVLSREMNDVDHGKNRKVILLITAGSPIRDEESIQMAREAKRTADEKGIEIYVMAWGESPSTDLLNEIVGNNRDHLQFAKDSDNLVDVYRTIFALMIGSDPKSSGSKTKLEDGKSEILLKIPNKSVSEVNIILPLAKVEDLELKDPDGKTIAKSDDNVLVSQSRYFMTYKLIGPRPEVYRLNYTSKSEEDFNIQYVFSYDVSLKATINEQNSYTAAKNDTVTVKAYFLDGEGQKSSDENLYKDHTGEEGYEDWMTVRANWELFRVDDNGETVGDHIKTGTLEADEVQKVFSTEITLNPDEGLQAGKYMLRINATGAGINRYTELPINVKNRVPEAANETDDIIVNLTNEYPDGPSWKRQTNVPWKNANDIVTDRDGEKLSFSLEKIDDEAATITLDPDTGEISYSTNADGEKVKKGKAEYKLWYTDNDPAGWPEDSNGQGSVLIRLNVHSQWDEQKDNYKAEITITGDRLPGSREEDNIFLKNRDITVTVSLKEGDKPVEGDKLNDFYPAKIQIGDNPEQELKINEDGNAFEYSFNTGNKGADWDIAASIGPFAGPDDSVKGQMKVSNSFDPEAKASESITINTDGAKVPGFLQAVIGTETEEDAEIRRFTVGKLFSEDQDGDSLEYSEPAFFRENTDETFPGEDIHAETEDGQDDNRQYRIIVNGESTGLFSYSFKSIMKVTATDGDGRTGTYEQAVIVVDLYNKMLTYAIILGILIVALIILALIIHQIRKPYFPVLKVTIREEPSLYALSSANLSPVKSWMDVNRIGVDSDIAAKHNISMEYLQNITIRPLRSKTAIGFRVKKPIPGHDTLLDDVVMKPKKWHEWRVGQELGVRCTGGEGMIAIKLDLPDGEDDVPGQEIFDDTGDWSDAGDFSTPATTSSAKRGRKVNRKAAPPEDDTFTGSSDDFEF